MVMGQQYSLGRRGLSRLARTRPYMAEAGTRDSKFENEILVLRPPSWNPIHPPWKPLSTVMLSQALALQC